MRPLFLRGNLAIPATELECKAVRASGPGGQNVNKVSSKACLAFDFDQSTVLSAATKARLRAMHKKRLDSEGRLLVTCQTSRDLSINLERARSRLAAIVVEAMTPPVPRISTQPSRASRERRLMAKRRKTIKKQQRRHVVDEN